MKLINIHENMGGGRDYYADFECEHCGHKANYVPCYNDANFDDNVIPNALCPKCNKSSSGETEQEQQKRLGRVYRHWRGLFAK